MTTIVLKGARQNNLKNIDVNIPRNKIVLFTGVSGSGKSSLVFETITAEAQRQLYDTFSTFARSRLPKFEQADYDSITNLSPVIVLEQKRNTANSRSTVGTISEISSFLRLLFSRIGTPFVGSSNHFSFNSQEGMCVTCGGIGTINDLNMAKVVDTSKSLKEGAILFPDFKLESLAWKLIANTGFFDLNKPLKDYTSEELNLLYNAEEVPFCLSEGDASFKANFNGVLFKIRRGFLNKDINSLTRRRREMITACIHSTKCPDCQGSRLNSAALKSKISGKNIYELSNYQISDLLIFLSTIENKAVETVLHHLKNRLHNLERIGIGYLNLSRATATLSGGEMQRVQLAKQLGNSLTEMIYVLDEPSTGLHPRDVHLVNELLQKLRDSGNTILVVEHDPDIIKIADHVIDIGPEAGERGGKIIFEGSFDKLMESDTATGRLLKAKLAPKNEFRSFHEFFTIANAIDNNLKNISVKIPKGVVTCITGVAGSGKSSLIHQSFLKKYPEAIIIDQNPVGQSIRSNPATYTGVFDPIRKIFSRANNGVNPSFFSFNAEGACPKCKGLGYIEMDLAFLDSVKTVCEECGGLRYKKEALRYKYKGYSITDVLTLTINQASELFEEIAVLKRLQVLQQVGLGYLKLGQSLSTLSGGECQRVKLASELHKEGMVYILDEPTTGLHLSDISKIIELLNKLVDRGNTLIIIEHSLDIISNADWLIDLGPEGGDAGGEILFEGTPKQIIDCGKGYTGKYLKQYQTGVDA